MTIIGYKMCGLTLSNQISKGTTISVKVAGASVL